MKMLTEGQYNQLKARAEIGDAIAKALAAPGALPLVARILQQSRETRYFDIYHQGSLYMERNWLVEKTKRDTRAGIRIHRIVRSDIDRHLHDHPGWSLSIVLHGGYFEELPIEPRAELARWTDEGQEQTYQVWRAPGDIVYREATDRHRIVIPEGQESLSLFVIGPTVNKWGFYMPAGKVTWEDYLGEAKDSQGEPGNMGVM